MDKKAWNRKDLKKLAESVYDYLPYNVEDTDIVDIAYLPVKELLSFQKYLQKLVAIELKRKKQYERSRR